jgi:DNA ligase-1
MLAESADDVAEAIRRLGEAAVELKLDGARIQVHKRGEAVRVYSRNLRDVTAAVPEVVDAARALSVRDAILDGEVVALRGDAAPQPFQITMRRFGRRRKAPAGLDEARRAESGRRLDVEALRREVPLTPYFFDLLLLDGDALVDEPQARRFAALTETAPPALVIPHVVTARPDEADAFLARALERGHEGVVAKARGAPYAAGRRGAAWIKVKRARTLDLVVLAAEWGSGRRRGWLSNLHLGARDPVSGGFVMLGKTFKGLTDATLAWQTGRLLELEIARDAHTVHVRPELVVEIAFNDVQRSPQYPGGVALRFARVVRYRPDKTAADADTIETVRGTAGSTR